VRNLLAGNSVIPVITLDRAEDAVPLAEALVAGGLKVLEVTLRTEAAVEVLSRSLSMSLKPLSAQVRSALGNR